MENQSIKKIRSLMERLERPYGRLDEASKPRIQVTRDELIDTLNSLDVDGKGKFVALTYVCPKKVYTTKRAWRSDDVKSALDKYQDRSEEDWYKKISDFNKEGSKGKNPVSQIIAVQRYILKWNSPEGYGKAYGKYEKDLSTLRMRNGIAIDSDGKLDTNKNIRQKSDYGVQFNQTGSMSKDFNMIGSTCQITAYLVDDNGDLVQEIPYDVVKAMSSNSPRGGDPTVAKYLDGDALKAYYEAKKELDAYFRAQNLLFDRILTVVATTKEKSFYYINDKLATPISSGSSVNVNPETMKQMAIEQLGQSFDEISGFEN